MWGCAGLARTIPRERPEAATAIIGEKTAQRAVQKIGIVPNGNNSYRFSFADVAARLLPNAFLIQSSRARIEAVTSEISAPASGGRREGDRLGPCSSGKESVPTLLVKNHLICDVEHKMPVQDVNDMGTRK